MHSERDPEFGVEVHPKKMLKLVKKEKVPFHKWFFWVDKKIKAMAKEQRAEEEMLRIQRQVEAKRAQQTVATQGAPTG